MVRADYPFPLPPSRFLGRGFEHCADLPYSGAMGVNGGNWGRGAGSGWNPALAGVLLLLPGAPWATNAVAADALLQTARTVPQADEFAIARMRATHLRATASEFKQLARHAQPKDLSSRQHTQAVQHAHWLMNNVRKLEHLARGWDQLLRPTSGARILSPNQLKRIREMSGGFSLQYEQLRDTMQKQSERYTTEHPALHNRYEAVRNAIRRLR